jgi:glycosyltransferase involved in cell wall biosynthesis
MADRTVTPRTRTSQAPPALEENVRPLLTVVVPVYNQAGSIVENVEEIRRRIAGALVEPIELVVVSDGSIDYTAEQLLAARSADVRLIHYDRNLGKGYAVKLGALAARGEWVSYVDADLDLDPASIPRFLEVARRERLDFVIGSKRHPESVVHYPRSRRVASWLYQQLIRLLFRLDVSDTQVGLKVFRREVAAQVMPLLLVKRYAFDLELLAVSRALGFRRLRELPVTLQYRFTGSGVRSAAVLNALIDTAAIFYRLRVLRYYERKRRALGPTSWRRALNYRPLVSVVVSDERVAERLDYPRLEVLPTEDTAAARRSTAARAQGEVLAFLQPNGAPASNWLESTVPFLASRDVAAVVTPTMVPHRGSWLQQAAGAIWESRLGGGSLYFRFTPGNLRLVRDFPADRVVIRKDEFLAATEQGGDEASLCQHLHASGKRVLYTPESVVVEARPPLFRPHLRSVIAYGRTRGRAVRRLRWSGIRASTLGPLALVPVLPVAAILMTQDGPWRLAGTTAWAVYLGAIALSAAVAAVRFQSARVGLLAAIGFPLTHLAYAGAFIRGLRR